MILPSKTAYQSLKLPNHSLNNYLHRAIDYLVPRHCLFCLEPTHNHNDLCNYCTGQLQQNIHACQRCALPLKSSENHICGNCLSHKFYFDQVYSPLIYADEIRYLIRQLKYHKKIHYARTLSGLFIQQSSHFNDFQLPQLLLPVPMHKQRLQQRGYNQALELARFFSSHFKIPLDYQSLLRCQSTRLQAGLNARERQKNIRNAFKNRTAGHKLKLSDYQHIALIDDVMTTGSTLNEAARTLKQAGIKRVDAWVIARA